MTEQINNTRNKIQMTKEKIDMADSMINVIHHYTNIENNDDAKEMLSGIECFIDHCKTMQDN